MGIAVANIIRLSIRIFLLMFLSLSLASIAAADSDNSIIYGISENILIVYDPNSNTLNSYPQPYPIDQIATSPGVVYLTYHDLSRVVHLKILSTSNYKEINSMTFDDSTKDNIVVNPTGTFVYLQQDYSIHKIDWVAGKEVASFTPGLSWGMNDISMSADGGFLIVSGLYNGVQNVYTIDTDTLASTIVVVSNQTYVPTTAIEGDYYTRSTGVISPSVYGYYGGYLNDGTIFYSSAQGSVKLNTGYLISVLVFLGHSEILNTSAQPPGGTSSSYQKFFVTYRNNNTVSVKYVDYYYVMGAPSGHYEYRINNVTTIYTNSSANNAVLVSNDGSRIYVSSKDNNVLQVYQNNNSYQLIGNITLPGITTQLCRGYKTSATQLVQFVVTTMSQTFRMENMTVTLYDQEGNLVSTGKTGTDGAISYLLSPIQMYTIVVNNTELNVNHTYTTVPGQNWYNLNIPVDEVSGLVNYPETVNNNTQFVQISYGMVVTQDINNNTINVTANLNDPTGQTEATYYRFTQSPADQGLPIIIYENYVYGQNTAVIFQVPNAAGNTYTMTFSAIQHDGRVLNYTAGTNVAGPAVLAGVVPPTYLAWFAIIMVAVIMAAGVATVGYVSVFGVVAYAVFNQFRWFDIYLQYLPLAQEVGPQNVGWAATALVGVIAIGVILVEKELHG